VANVILQQQYDDLDDAHFPSLHEFQYRLPSLPKASVIANINAAILAAILTVVFTMVNQHKFIDSILYFSNLILCFTFGAIVAVLSCVFDYKARTIYRASASKKLFLIDVGEIYDATALCIFIASLGIFVWGSYLTIFLVRSAFA